MKFLSFSANVPNLSYKNICYFYEKISNNDVFLELMLRFAMMPNYRRNCKFWTRIAPCWQISPGNICFLMLVMNIWKVARRKEIVFRILCKMRMLNNFEQSNGRFVFWIRYFAKGKLGPKCEWKCIFLRPLIIIFRFRHVDLLAEKYTQWKFFC